MENIAGYVYDHTTWDERYWQGLEAAQRGPYFVAAIYAPRTERFLKFIRQHREKKPDCDPVDGREHSVAEMTRWIGIRELALRFIGLGVLLGVFELVRPWEEREGESREQMIQRLEGGAEGWFKLKMRRRSELTAGASPGVLADRQILGRHSSVGVRCPRCGVASPVS